jgi:hypothetical protein
MLCSEIKEVWLKMMTELKTRASFLKYVVIFAGLALLIGLAVTWLRSGETAPPKVTEHIFESGHAAWSIDTYPAKVLHENHFVIDLTDQSGAPLQGAALSVKLDMVNMVCGDYAFKMTEIAPGKYTGEGVPLMAGTWKATLSLVTETQKEYTIIRLLSAVH